MFRKYTNSFLKDFDVDKLLSEFIAKEFNSYQEGCFIFSKNEIISGIHFILRGEIEILDTAVSEPVILGYSRAGDIIGLDSAFAGDRYFNSVKAVKITETISVNKHDFVNYLKSDPEFNLWILSYMSNFPKNKSK